MATDVTSTANSTNTTALNTSSSGLSPLEQQSMQGLSGDDRARMEAQLALQKEQETVSFISNMLKKKNEIAMAVIGNLK
jgi:hypothetical protein